MDRDVSKRRFHADRRRACTYLEPIHSVSVFAQKCAALTGPFGSQKIGVAYRGFRKREITTASRPPDKNRNRDSRESPSVTTTQ